MEVSSTPFVNLLTRHTVSYTLGLQLNPTRFGFRMDGAMEGRSRKKRLNLGAFIIHGVLFALLFSRKLCPCWGRAQLMEGKGEFRKQGQI